MEITEIKFYKFRFRGYRCKYDGWGLDRETFEADYYGAYLEGPRKGECFLLSKSLITKLNKESK